MKFNSKIYIAGHTGLVGSNIYNGLSKVGYKNLITSDFSELDLRNQQAVDNFFEQNRPEYVFLAAAKVGGILANDTYKAEFIYDNLMIATNIIHASYKYGVKKLLNLGSSCIYPKLALQPLKEEYLLSNYLEPTNEPYSIAKITAIKLCRYYNEQYGTNFISVMPTNLYGPGDNFNLETAHVLPMLLRKMHLAKLLYNDDWDGIKKDLKTYKFGFNITFDFEDKNKIKNMLKEIGVTAKTVKLWGTGSPYREFLYVQDLVDALIFLMKNSDYTDIGEIINIGTGIDIQIKVLANVIKDIVGFNGDIEFDNLKPDGTPKKLLDVSRINHLGWKNSIDLETGIKNFYDWYANRCINKNNHLQKIEKKRVSL
ncbi:GDP-L-fucose synthase family protein [Candidatus Dependentiae bacterium]